MKVGQKHSPEARAHFLIGWGKRRAEMPSFWERVIKTDTCWLWPSVRPNGYGQIKVHGHNLSAHRVAYELAKGPIPEGLTIDHLCRTRACVNPEHLEAVSAGENVRRSPTAATAVNARKTHCIHGHPLSGENLRMATKDGGPWRICLTCKGADTARSNARQTHKLREDPAYRERINARRRERYAKKALP